MATNPDRTDSTEKAACQQADRITDQARGAAQQIAGTTPEEAAQVKDEALGQAKSLAASAKDEVLSQAGAQQQRVAPVTCHPFTANHSASDPAPQRPRVPSPGRGRRSQGSGADWVGWWPSMTRGRRPRSRPSTRDRNPASTPTPSARTGRLQGLDRPAQVGHHQFTVDVRRGPDLPGGCSPDLRHEAGGIAGRPHPRNGSRAKFVGLDDRPHRGFRRDETATSRSSTSTRAMTVCSY